MKNILLKTIKLQCHITKKKKKIFSKIVSKYVYRFSQVAYLLYLIYIVGNVKNKQNFNILPQCEEVHKTFVPS